MYERLPKIKTNKKIKILPRAKIKIKKVIIILPPSVKTKKTKKIN